MKNLVLLSSIIGLFDCPTTSLAFGTRPSSYHVNRNRKQRFSSAATTVLYSSKEKEDKATSSITNNQNDDDDFIVNFFESTGSEINDVMSCLKLIFEASSASLTG